MAHTTTQHSRQKKATLKRRMDRLCKELLRQPDPAPLDINEISCINLHHTLMAEMHF